MPNRFIRLFIFSAGVLLLITGTAKFISASGHSRILQVADPIFDMPFRYVFWIVGGFELGIALICMLKNCVGLEAILLTWLATGFVIYRFGLWWLNYQRPCGCLGNLTDALHIPPQIADTAMKIILAYLLIGSYATLFWLWRQRRQIGDGS